MSLNSTDRLIPLLPGDAAVNNGCTFSIDGAIGNGTSAYVDLNWNSIDDARFTWNNLETAFHWYVERDDHTSGHGMICGADGDEFHEQLSVYESGTTNISAFFGDGSRPFNTGNTKDFTEQKNYAVTITDEGDNAGDLWEDGSIVHEHTNSSGGGAECPMDLALLARNNETGGYTLFGDFTVPYLAITQGDFDFAHWNTQIKIFLASLGMTIP